MQGAVPVLFYENEAVDEVTFPPVGDFYKRRTASGKPFIGNAVLQGLDWVAFPCLWPCVFAAAGKPCQFCFSGGSFESMAKKGKPLPKPLPATDAMEMIRYAVENEGARHTQLTGGSTYDGLTETALIIKYLEEVRVPGEIILYVTPPDLRAADAYFAHGATRVACSIEVWDMAHARKITPGKIEYTGRERYLDTLVYIAEKYGKGKALSNFIIGIEPFETLMEGATYLAERGVLPSASVWMPMGRPVSGKMNPPDIDYYKKVKEGFAKLYTKYGLEPPESRGLNVCIERDIWTYTT
jgi:hypothetical protein